MQFSQSFLDEIKKFLCSLESPFQVVLKNSPTFYYRTHMTKVMADKSLSTIFFRHPVFCFTAVLPHFEDKDLITNAMHYGTGYLRLGYAL